MGYNSIIQKRLKYFEQNGKSIKSYFNAIHTAKDRLFCQYGDVSKTYGDCEIYSKKLGSYFEKELASLPKHSFVGIMMENRLEFIPSFYGLLMAGYKPLLVNLKLSDELNQQIIDRMDVKYIVCDKDYKVTANKINVNNFNLDELPFEDKEFDWEDELAVSTSATSLNIKICVYDGKAIIEQVSNLDEIYRKNKGIFEGYKGQTKHTAFLPFYHIFGLMAMYFWCAMVNTCYVFLKDYSSDTILKTVRDYQITNIFAVPMLWNGVAKAITKQLDTDPALKRKFYKGLNLSIKLQKAFPKLGYSIAKKLFKDVRKKIFGETTYFLVSGGSDLPKETLRILNGIGYKVYNGYGMSEIGVTSVVISKNIKDRITGSVGKPLSKVEYKINEEGLLLVKSKGICNRVITKDQEIIINNEEFFNTGDYAKCVNGDYYLYGRSDDIVLSETGEKINPTIIENKMNLQHVERYSVLGIEVDNKEYLSLLVEIDKDFDETRINKIVNSVYENLNLLKDFNYNIEKVFYTYDKIISPTSIKISRKLITKWIKSNQISIHPLNTLKSMKAETLTEEQLEVASYVKEVFSAVLNTDINNISIDSHFIYDLGGTSLEYLALISRLQEKYPYDFVLEESSYTVIDFVNYIIKNKGEN